MTAMLEPLARHIRHAACWLLAAISSLTMPELAKSQAAAGIWRWRRYLNATVTLLPTELPRDELGSAERSEFA
jgi:hypothetical protein